MCTISNQKCIQVISSKDQVLFHHTHVRANIRNSLQNALCAFTVINNRTRPAANIYRELWFVEGHQGTAKWGWKRWRGGGVVEKSFLPVGKTVFYTLCSRFISPNRFSNDSSTAFLLLRSTYLREYKYPVRFYFSFRLIHAVDFISAEILSQVYRDILPRRRRGSYDVDTV